MRSSFNPFDSSNFENFPDLEILFQRFNVAPNSPFSHLDLSLETMSRVTGGPANFTEDTLTNDSMAAMQSSSIPLYRGDQAGDAADGSALTPGRPPRTPLSKWPAAGLSNAMRSPAPVPGMSPAAPPSDASLDLLLSPIRPMATNPHLQRHMPYSDPSLYHPSPVRSTAHEFLNSHGHLLGGSQPFSPYSPMPDRNHLPGTASPSSYRPYAFMTPPLAPVVTPQKRLRFELGPRQLNYDLEGLPSPSPPLSPIQAVDGWHNEDGLGEPSKATSDLTASHSAPAPIPHDAHHNISPVPPDAPSYSSSSPSGKVLPGSYAEVITANTTDLACPASQSVSSPLPAASGCYATSQAAPVVNVTSMPMAMFAGAVPPSVRGSATSDNDNQASHHSSSSSMDSPLLVDAAVSTTPPSLPSPVRVHQHRPSNGRNEPLGHMMEVRPPSRHHSPHSQHSHRSKRGRKADAERSSDDRDRQLLQLFRRLLQAMERDHYLSDEESDSSSSGTDPEKTLPQHLSCHSLTSSGSAGKLVSDPISSPQLDASTNLYISSLTASEGVMAGDAATTVDRDQRHTFEKGTQTTPLKQKARNRSAPINSAPLSSTPSFAEELPNATCSCLKGSGLPPRHMLHTTQVPIAMETCRCHRPSYVPHVRPYLPLHTDSMPWRPLPLNSTFPPWTPSFSSMGAMQRPLYMMPSPLRHTGWQAEGFPALTPFPRHDQPYGASLYRFANHSPPTAQRRWRSTSPAARFKTGEYLAPDWAVEWQARKMQRQATTISKDSSSSQSSGEFRQLARQLAAATARRRGHPPGHPHSAGRSSSRGLFGHHSLLDLDSDSSSD